MRKLFSIIFILILITISFLDYYYFFKQFEGKEKLNAKVDSITKSHYVDGDIVKDVKNIRYSFYCFDGIDTVMKYDVFSGNRLFVKEGQNLTIFYDKVSATSVVYIFPVTLVFIIMLTLFYMVTIALVIINKININIIYEEPNPPLYCQFITISMVYGFYRFDNNIMAYFMSFFAMFVGLGIAIQTLCSVLKKIKNNKSKTV